MKRDGRDGVAGGQVDTPGGLSRARWRASAASGAGGVPVSARNPNRRARLLSTVPFLALLALLAVLAVAIMVTAFPGTQPQREAARGREERTRRRAERLVPGSAEGIPPLAAAGVHRAAILRGTREDAC